MSKLHIHLLGPPQIFWDDQPIVISRRMPRGLLYYLAAHRQPLARPDLILTFWGERQPEKKARQRLRENLSRLRAQLPDPDLLIIQGDWISLDRDQVWVDLLEFENRIEQANQHILETSGADHLSEEGYSLVNQAINLWRRPSFLARLDLPGSLAFESWQMQTVSHLEKLYCAALEKVIAHEIQVRNFPRALVLTRQGLEIDSFNEYLLTALMRSLISIGQYAEARQHYEHTCVLLEVEIGLPPPAEMVELQAQIDQIDTGLPIAALDWEMHTAREVPLVGRQPILRQITTAFARHQGVIILGESGQGKTRLMREYTQRMPPKTRVILTRGQILDNALPYQPIIDAFRQNMTPEEWQLLPLDLAIQISSLIPEIRAARGDLGFQATAQLVLQNEASLLDAIRQVLVVLAKTQPLLLVVDDLQWADDATLLALNYLLKKEPFTEQAWFLGAARSEDHNAHLSDLLLSVQVNHLAAVIHLKQLLPRQVSEIASYLLPEPPKPAFVEQLAKVSAGNPLFILEILHALLLKDVNPDLSGAVSLPLTTNLRNLILNRIATLQPATQELLRIAAVSGVEFSLQLVSLSSQYPPAEAARYIQELENAHLIVHSGPSENPRYQFRHDTIRKTVLDSLTASRTQLIHRQIALAWQKSQANPPPAAVLAYHLESGGETAAAFHCWVDAGRHARQLFAQKDANQAFARARTLIDQTGNLLSDQAIYQLYAEWCEMAHELNQINLVTELGQELLALGQERQSALLLGTAYNILSDTCMTTEGISEGLNYATLAIPYLEQTDQIFELLGAYAQRGIFLYMSGQVEQAIELLQFGLAKSAQSDAIQTLKARAYLYYQLSLLQTLQGWPAKGREYAQKGIRDAKNGQRLDMWAMCHDMLSFSQVYLGNYQQALAGSLESIELFRQMQARRILVFALCYAAMAEIGLGQLDAAFAHAQEALQIAEADRRLDVVSLACRQLGELFRLLQDYPKAAEYYLRGFEAFPENFMGLDNAYRLGLVRVYLGQPDGLAQIENVQFGFEMFTITAGVIGAQLCRTIALLEIGEWQDQSPLIESLIGETQLRELGPYWSLATILSGEIALRSGDAPKARLNFQLAADWASAHNNPWLELSALMRLEKADQKAGLEQQATAARIAALVEALAVHTTHPELQDSFATFRTQILTRTGIAPATI